MVRLKNRYLLLDILYPDPSTWPSTKQPHSSTSTPAQLAIHAPTSDALTPGLLAKMIRDEVSELYGDWGVGKLGGASAGGVNGKLHALIPCLKSHIERDLNTLSNPRLNCCLSTRPEFPILTLMS